MTNLEFVISAIKKRFVEVPAGFTVEEMQKYLEGYADCQSDIINLIKTLAKPQ